MSTARDEIANLVYRYAELMDQGDFAAAGDLFAVAKYGAGEGALVDGALFEQINRSVVVLYEDGTPKTKHVTTNLIVELDEGEGRAAARSYFSVYQALPDFPLQPIVMGRYHDRFAQDHEGRWHFTERRIFMDLLGDLSRHLVQG